MRKLTHAEILEQQKDNGPKPKLPLTVVLNNIRSLHNVGAIFRTCDGVGVEKLWLCGITGYPPDAQIAKTALGAERSVPWGYAKDCLPVIQDLKKKGYQIVLLEQTTQSIPHDRFEPKAPVCLVLGNEVEGVAGQVVACCDVAVDIAMAGVKNSLNVAVAFGVAAYHIRSRLVASLTVSSVS